MVPLKDDWESFIATYSKWQNGVLQNKNLKCTDLQAVVFTPRAGLGDSANALRSSELIQNVKRKRDLRF